MSTTLLSSPQNRMGTDAHKALHLPWNQSEGYWLCVVTPPESTQLKERLLTLDGTRSLGDGSIIGMSAPRAWGECWQKIRALMSNPSESPVQAAVIADNGTIPDAQLLEMNRRPAEEIDHIAAHLWLGDALMEGLVTCYLQPVIDRRGKKFGCESLARLTLPNGQRISGGRIFEASHALKIEHVIDRHLHVQAVRTFAQSDSQGFLFINFVDGFIQRPEKYLEGLNEAAQNYGIAPKHIVLDFTQAEGPKNIAHLKSVCEFARARGYSLALDDIVSFDAAQRMITDIRPDFLKLDLALTRRTMMPEGQTLISTLIDIAHKNGAMVVAEGVEHEDVHQTLLRLGADLFQGYLFSPPEAA